MRTNDDLTELAIDRSDIYVGRIGPPAEVGAAQPMLVEAVTRFLGISAEELVGLVKTGKIPRPGSFGDGVAWRTDEVCNLMPWIDERRDDGLPLA